MWVYCTKEDVAGYSGLSVEKLSDTWSKIVEGLIDEHTGGKFGETAQYTEAYDGNGSDTIMLNRKPVVSVSALSVEDVSLQSTEYKVYSSGYIRLVSSTGSALDAALGTVGSAFPVGQQNVSVTYTAHTATVPAYVQLAAILCVTEMAMIGERAGADSSLAVSRATQRAGESDRSFRRSTDISGKLRLIIRNTIGKKWRFE